MDPKASAGQQVEAKKKCPNRNGAKTAQIFPRQAYMDKECIKSLKAEEGKTFNPYENREEWVYSRGSLASKQNQKVQQAGWKVTMINHKTELT